MLDVKDVSKSYGRGVRALHAVTFSIPKGGSCAVVGPSGSGKTTLLGLCAGLDRPSTGTVAVDGDLLNNMSEDGLASLRNRKIGFVFQNFQLLGALTALENVSVPAELAGYRDAQQRAKLWLERVGLKDRLEHFPSELSGGEQQRVAIARAFVNEPAIILADEPTGNLDSQTSETVAELLFQLNHEQGTTLVLATHDMSLAKRASRTITLRGGEIAAL